jgi:hypothetical protein
MANKIDPENQTNEFENGVLEKIMELDQQIDSN